MLFLVFAFGLAFDLDTFLPLTVDIMFVNDDHGFSLAVLLRGFRDGSGVEANSWIE